MDLWQFLKEVFPHFLLTLGATSIGMNAKSMSLNAKFRTWFSVMVRRMSNEWKIGALVGLFGVLFLSMLQVLQPYYFTHDDNTSQNLPMRLHNLECIVKFGELAFMNFHQFLGHAHYLSGQSGVLYFPAYIATALSYYFMGHGLASVDIDASLHLLCGLFAMYAYLRVVGIPAILSGQSSLLYATTPFLIIGAKSWLVFAYCMAFVPMLFMCLEAWFRTGRSWWLLLSATLKIGFFFQGNVQFPFMYLFAEIIYAAVRLCSLKSKDAKRLCISWLISNIVACTGALPLLWPMAQAAASSAGRSEAISSAIRINNAIDTWSWFKAQAFIFYPGRTFVASSALQHFGASLLIFFLVVTYLWNNPIRENQIWAILVLFFAAFLLSTKANVILNRLPPFDRFRWPFKWYYLCPFSFWALTAYSLNGLRVMQWIGERGSWGLFMVALISHCVILLSPLSLVGFSPLRVFPEVLRRNKNECWTKGRIIPYGISFVNTTEAVVESRAQNFATLLGESAFHGYDPLIARSVDEEVYHMNQWSALPRPLTHEVLDHLSSWSVRFFVTTEKTNTLYPLNLFPELKMKGRTPSGLMLWENNAARPWAYFDHTTNKSLPVAFGANTCAIRVDKACGSLVVNVFDLPGWTASLDGRGTDLNRRDLDHHIRIEVPAGVEEVLLRYSPPYLDVSLLITLTALPLLILFWWKWEASWSDCFRRKTHASGV